VPLFSLDGLDELMALLWIRRKNDGVIDLHSLNVEQAISVVHNCVTTWRFNSEYKKKESNLVSWEQR
jgi:hypothetical protein